ncbi:radical SAM/SPASM domain-containing protein [uncultured Desulfosarcina sp.]|uniref:radical SAM/SPASM domain-containing protein n=1 Tax=uncultured Desulfosarcina sp. TaxID=218289 RepID=UPI0029C73B0E|nr:SPASM domain-containing protein [uncultured Desulfosarcina sp.]
MVIGKKVYRSSYNYFFKYAENIIGYNARTGILALLSDEDAELLQKHRDISGHDTNRLDELQSFGFVHEGDELSKIKDRFNARTNDENYIHLAIAPTLLCNFNCPYCYEKNVKTIGGMSEGVQESTLRYVESLLANKKKSISITWFGGEPLLEYETVVNMSNKFNDLVSCYKSEIDSLMIITNGVKINPTILHNLNEIGIKKIQISVDSKIFERPYKRGLIDRRGNPSIILKNIIDASKKIDRLFIRINTDGNNLKEVVDLISILQQYGLDQKARLAPITHYHEDICGKKIISFTEGLYGEKRLKKFSELERNIYSGLQPFEDYFSMLKPKNCFCGANSDEMIVVDPLGRIYRCWHSVGNPDEAIGTVFDGIKNNQIEKKWKSYDPFSNDDCINCKVLPLCMGGCTHPKLFVSQSAYTCESIKFQVSFYLDQLANLIPMIKPELF